MRLSIPVAIALLILFINPSWSQSDTTVIDTSKASVYRYSNKDFAFDSSSFQVEPKDSSFLYPRIWFIGNIGRPIAPLTLDEFSFLPGFSLRKNYWSRYLMRNEDISFYKTRKPFTYLDYTAGSKREQLFKFIHAQNVTPNLSFSIRFNRIRSEGFYLRQVTDLTSLGGNVGFIPKNKRYNFLFSGYMNFGKLQENGGIRGDTIFERLENADKKLASINLSAATSGFRENEVDLEQRLLLGRRLESLNDSVKGNLKPDLILFHRIKYKTDIFKYIDENPQSGFYENVYVDTLVTRDSIRNYGLSNAIGFVFQPTLPKGRFSFSTAAGEERNQVYLSGKDTSFRDYFISSEIQSAFKDKLFFTFSGKYFLKGQHEKSGVAIIHATYRASPRMHFNASSTVKTSFPSFTDRFYYSNHFQWNNDFDFIKEQNTSAGLNYLPWKAEASFGLKKIENLVYYNSFSAPVQFNSVVNILYAKLNWKYAYRKFRIETRVIYQSVRDSIPLRLPEFVNHTSFAFKDGWFKNDALIVALGINLHYFSSVYAYGYNPALGQFLIQNEEIIGNYPYFDAFADLQIRSVNITFMLRHVNSGISGMDYYTALNYPQPDRAFALRVRWSFND